MALKDRLKARAEAGEVFIPEEMPEEQPKTATLRDRLRQKAIERDREKYSPTSGMSGADQFLAGIGKGMTDVVQGAGNIVGLVEDETLEERKQLDAPLMETGAGKFGSFVGETAALLPLALATGGSGVVGQAGARLATTAPKLARALPYMTGGAVEGAAGGAILADPGERAKGAVTGGLVGGALGGSLPILSSALKKAGQKAGVGEGLVKISPEAKRLKEAVKKRTGRDTFIPAAQAAESDLAKKVFQLAGTQPGVGGRVAKQSEAAMDDYYETVAQDMFRMSPKGREAAMATMRETGSLTDAMDAGRVAQGLTKKGVLRKMDKRQQAIYDLASKSAGRPKPSLIAKTLAKEAAPGSRLGQYPAYTEALGAQSVFDMPKDLKGLWERGISYAITAATSGGSIPLGRALTNERVQRALMGDTKLQTMLREYVNSPTEQTASKLMRVLAPIAGAQAGQAVGENDA